MALISPPPNQKPSNANKGRKLPRDLHEIINAVYFETSEQLTKRATNKEEAKKKVFIKSVVNLIFIQLKFEDAVQNTEIVSYFKYFQ